MQQKEGAIGPFFRFYSPTGVRRHPIKSVYKDALSLTGLMTQKKD